MAMARDSQRAKFFNWYYGYLSALGGPGYGLQYGEAERKINQTISDYGFQPPRFRNRNGSRNPQYVAGCIFLTPLKNVALDDLCKVCAYVIIDKRNMAGEDNAWHGPAFCRIFADTYAKYSGLDAKDIVNSMKVAGLKVLGANGISQAGPRTSKQLQTAREKVVRLDKAIKLGRQEFEAFLQPILQEFEEAKKQVKALESKIRG